MKDIATWGRNANRNAGKYSENVDALIEAAYRNGAGKLIIFPCWLFRRLRRAGGERKERGGKEKGDEEWRFKTKDLSSGLSSGIV